jgi:hypothetical protein
LFICQLRPLCGVDRPIFVVNARPCQAKHVAWAR